MDKTLKQEICQSRVEWFSAKYGVEPGVVEQLFREGSPLPTILQTMYYGAMEELRECILKENGERIQGQAQALWTLLNIPKEIEEISNLD